jgi:hypothetical protein
MLGSVPPKRLVTQLRQRKYESAIAYPWPSSKPMEERASERDKKYRLVPEEASPSRQ